MTTEEKAKAYNKAIQKAKDYYNEKTKINPELSKVLELIFPELKKSEDERIKEEIIDFLNLPHPQFVGKRDYKDWIAWLEKQGKQKPNNNIELKFKVGDWVADNLGRVGQISSVTDDGYEFCLYDGTYISGCWKDDYHHWTIQDAKDGDVLVWDNSNCIALFRNIYDKESFQSHGFEGHCTGKFVSEISYHDIAGAHPATKEERNLFFRKMKKEGYEWDDDKKELRKIEHSNEESNKFEPFYSFKNDNEYMCESIIDVLTNNTVLGSKGREIYSKYIEWLKSLRNTKILVEKDDEIKK